MKNIKGFGEKVEGYNVPVLNEREIRASAGILFLFALISLFTIIADQNFVPIKYFIFIFAFDFIIRLFINPRYSPTLIIGRLIVIKQVPEYTGAPQKRFAWIIGLILALIMMALMALYNTYSIITGLICLICLIFLFFESVFGICLGCIFYNLIYKKQPELCPGDSCKVKEKHEIQKIKGVHLLILAGLIAYIILVGVLLNDYFKEKPQDLWIKMGVKTENVNH
jgi:hypothetical protein